MSREGDTQGYFPSLMFGTPVNQGAMPTYTSPRPNRSPQRGSGSGSPGLGLSRRSLTPDRPTFADPPKLSMYDAQPSEHAEGLQGKAHRLAATRRCCGQNRINVAHTTAHVPYQCIAVPPAQAEEAQEATAPASDAQIQASCSGSCTPATSAAPPPQPACHLSGASWAQQAA